MTAAPRPAPGTAPGQTGARFARSYAPVLGVVVLAVLATAPLLLHRGFALVADMTFVPHQPWKGEWLALDGSIPRAVPADALVSIVSRVLPGDLLQKAILAGALVLAGTGMLRLLRERAPAASFGGAALFVWNAWVFERLAIGHWGLLLGYAALPWVVHAALAVRRSGWPATSALVLWLAFSAATSPTGGLVAGLTALVLVWDRRVLRAGLAVIGATMAVNLPWLVPALLHTAGGSDPNGVRTFAAHADTPLGTPASLLTFGGIWKRSAAPGDRSSWVLVGATLVVVLGALVVLAAAARPARGARSSRAPVETGRLLVLAAGSFLLALLPATGAGGDVLQVVVGHVLGAGILRDSQKWLAAFVVVACVGFGCGLDLLHHWLRRRAPSAVPLVLAVALVPVVLLPSLAWGLAGRLEPVRYPAEWSAVRSLMDKDGIGGRQIAVLPWSTYQRLPWNGMRAALDPAIRFFPGQVVTSQDLVIDAHTTVSGEDLRGARIGAAVRNGEPLGPVLAEEGIDYVLLEKTAAGADQVDVPAGRVLHDGKELLLLDLGQRSRAPRPEHRVLILGADGVAVLAVLLGVVGSVRRRRSDSPEESSEIG